MSTFAIPNEKRGTKALQVWLKKFIEKTDYCTRSKYRENTIYREALISFRGNYKCRNQTGNIRNYTMKSLILAQDER